VRYVRLDTWRETEGVSVMITNSEVARRLCRLVYGIPNIQGPNYNDALRRGVLDIAIELDPCMAASEKMDTIRGIYNPPKLFTRKGETFPRLVSEMTEEERKEKAGG
jgi:hypothetical protein